MNDTLIFDVNKLLQDEEYRGITREEVEPYDGLIAIFTEEKWGTVRHPEGGYLYPIKKEHCIQQMSLF